GGWQAYSARPARRRPSRPSPIEAGLSPLQPGAAWTSFVLGSPNGPELFDVPFAARAFRSSALHPGEYGRAVTSACDRSAPADQRPLPAPSGNATANRETPMATGTITSATSTVALARTGGPVTLALITPPGPGTYTGISIIFECSPDGITWQPCLATPTVGG